MRTPAVDEAQIDPGCAVNTIAASALSRTEAPAIASVTTRTPINVALTFVRPNLRAKTSAMNHFLMLMAA